MPLNAMVCDLRKIILLVVVGDGCRGGVKVFNKPERSDTSEYMKA